MIINIRQVLVQSKIGERGPTEGGEGHWEPVEGYKGRHHMVRGAREVDDFGSMKLQFSNCSGQLGVYRECLDEKDRQGGWMTYPGSQLVDPLLIFPYSS